MRYTGCLLSLVMLLLTAGVLPGCRSSGDSTLHQMEPLSPVSEQPPSAGLQLPAPGSLPKIDPPLRRSAYTEQDLIDHAANFVSFFPHRNVTIDGSRLIFKSKWSRPYAASASNLAYAVYPMYVQGYDRDPVITYGWSDPPDDIGTAWIGLAKWDENRWVWRQCNATGRCAWPDFSSYTATDYLFAVVVTANDEDSVFQYIRVGQSQTFAALDAYPPLAIAPAHITLSAGGSTTGYGNITGYEWDWDFDGEFELDTGGTQTSAATRTGVGDFKATVRVTSEHGEQDTASTTYRFIEPWAHSWGLPDGDSLHDACAYAYESVYAAGETFDAGANEDVLVLKYDYEGNYYWARAWGGVNSDIGVAVEPVSGGDILVAGSTSSFGAGGADMFVQRWDPAGNLLWTTTWGGAESDTASDMLLAGGEIFLLGTTRSFGVAGQEVALICLDTDGDVLWQRTWGGGYSDRAYDMASSYSFFPDNHTLHITGETDSYGPSWGDNHVLYLSISDTGSLKKQMLWPSECAFQHSSISVSGMDGSDVFIAAADGLAGGVDALLLEVTTDPSPLAVKWGGDGIEQISAITRVQDNLLICGVTDSFTAEPSGFLLNLSPSGGIQGADIWQGSTATEFDSVGYLSGSGLLVSGTCYNAEGSFGPVSGTISTVTGTWEILPATLQTPSGTITSPSGTVRTVTTAVRDAGAGQPDGMVLAVPMP